MKIMTRFRRLRRMVEMLSERGYTIKELAQELGVTERTICRDLLDLQIEARVPLIEKTVYWIKKA